MVRTLSADATRLLVTGLGSIEKLELLVTLARASDRCASIADLARDARLPPAIARRIATEMQRAHVVEVASNGQVRLAPRDPRDRAAVEEMLAMHANMPAVLLRLLHGR